MGGGVNPAAGRERPLRRAPEGLLISARPVRRRDPRARAAILLSRLQEEYGRPRRSERRDPLDELVLTVLSQNTNDRNRDRAYVALRERFPRWEDILAATDAQVARAIRVGGLANQKARRIRQILARLKDERGTLDLDFVRRWPTRKIAEYLASFQGVGEKTINCVLLFSLGRKAFPVDTHIHRLAVRLGLASDNADAAEVHRIMHEQVPEVDYYPAHMNLIRHGREVCHARRPECAACTLSDLCPSRVEGAGRDTES